MVSKLSAFMLRAVRGKKSGKKKLVILLNAIHFLVASLNLP